jgi:hypothetical protein
MSKRRDDGLTIELLQFIDLSGRPNIKKEPDDTEEDIKRGEAWLAHEGDRIRQAQAAARQGPSGKRSRTNDRTGTLKKACQNAEDPTDPRSVLAALRALAQSKPQAPLLGYDVEEKSFKWDVGLDKGPAYQREKDALAVITRYLDKSR